ncbi:MAG: aldo/keto reductase [Bacillota bacterium]|nr:aldo/keto reductase [Bacillota bacterium]
MESSRGEVKLVEYRELGELRVSVVGLGCRRLAGPGMDYERARQVVHRALDAGITLFDTADNYGRGASEEVLGRALRGHRHEVVIATKVGIRRGLPATGSAPEGQGGEGAGGATAQGIPVATQDGTTAYLERATEDSLRRLGTDYIDLLQVHYPDPATPFEETARALAKLVRQGKARAVGLCNFTADDLEAWFGEQPGWPAESRPVALQAAYSLVQRDVEERVVDLARQHGLGLLAYMPLFLGYLGREPQPGDQEGDPHRALLPVPYVDGLARAVLRMRELGRDWGMTPAQMALRWVIERPGVVAALAGATRPEQVEENARAARPLPEEIGLALDDISRELAPVPPLLMQQSVLHCAPSPRGGHYVVLESGLKLPTPEPVRPGWVAEVDGWRGTILRAIPPEG